MKPFFIFLLYPTILGIITRLKKEKKEAEKTIRSDRFWKASYFWYACRKCQIWEVYPNYIDRLKKIIIKIKKEEGFKDQTEKKKTSQVCVWLILMKNICIIINDGQLSTAQLVIPLFEHHILKGKFTIFGKKSIFFMNFSLEVE